MTGTGAAYSNGITILDDARYHSSIKNQGMFSCFQYHIFEQFLG